MKVFCFTSPILPAQAFWTGFFCTAEQFHTIYACYYIAAYGSFPKYTVTFYNINRLSMNFLDFFWIYS